MMVYSLIKEAVICCLVYLVDTHTIRCAPNPKPNPLRQKLCYWMYGSV